MTIEEFLTELNWARGAAAIDSAGAVVDPNSTSAVWWSLYGAMVRVYGSENSNIRDRLEVAINTAIGSSGVTVEVFNDFIASSFADISTVVSQAAV